MLNVQSIIDLEREGTVEGSARGSQSENRRVLSKPDVGNRSSQVSVVRNVQSVDVVSLRIDFK